MVGLLLLVQRGQSTLSSANRPGLQGVGMKKILLAAAFLASSLQVSADSRIDAVEPEVRAQLTALEEAWINAEVQSDRNALEEILHEDFLSTFASGATLDRSSYIEFIVGLDLSPFKVTNESMVQHGDTVVVIDVSEDGATKFTWIAVRRDGRWQVVAQTLSAVEPSHQLPES